MYCSDYSNKSINFFSGIPSYDFVGNAWASEPLTNILEQTNIPFALPEPEEGISLIAKHEHKVVGQCSANRVVTYWNHVEKIDSTNQNLSTQIFIKIHKKAIETEKEYLKLIGEPAERSFHNAGIAVLPDYRGKSIGFLMTAKQIKLCKEHRATTIFCETTSRFSAAIVERLGFIKIAEYPYPKLAEEFNHASLTNLHDSFSVWCLQFKSSTINESHMRFTIPPRQVL